MQAKRSRLSRAKLALATTAMGSTLILGDCDPTVRATVEDGIINLSTAALGSVFDAVIELFQESQTEETTASLMRPGSDADLFA